MLINLCDFNVSECLRCVIFLSLVRRKSFVFRFYLSFCVLNVFMSLWILCLSVVIFFFVCCRFFVCIVLSFVCLCLMLFVAVARRRKFFVSAFVLAKRRCNVFVLFICM